MAMQQVAKQQVKENPKQMLRREPESFKVWKDQQVADQWTR